MEVPDAIISDGIKKKAGYKYYMAKKVESKKAKSVDKLEEQHVSPIKSGRGKGFMCYGDQVSNVPNKLKKDVMPRKRRSLTIAEEAVIGSLRQKKQPVVGERLSAAHNKYYSSLDTAGDATLYSSSSNESANEIDDADESDMDLSNDNLHRDGDDARYGVFMLNKSTATPNSTYFSLTVTSFSLDFNQTLLDETPTNKLKNFMSHPVYTDAQTTSVLHNQEGNPELTTYISRASEVPLGTHVDVLATKTFMQEMFRYENTHRIPSLPAKKIPYHTTTPQPSSLQAKAKKLMQKAKKNMRKFNFKEEVKLQKGSQRLKVQYKNDMELKYRISQLKATLFLKAQWKSDEEMSLNLDHVNDTCRKVQNHILASTTTITITLWISAQNRSTLLLSLSIMLRDTTKKIQENLIDIFSNNKLGSGNKRLKGRDWTDYDVKSSREMLKKIYEVLRHKEQLRRLEEYVGGCPKTINPRTFDQSAQLKRKHDDQDEDPTAGSDQGKDKKRPRKDTQPLKKSFASKVSSKGNTIPKTSKSCKSVIVEEQDEEHVHDMLLDAEENIADEIRNANKLPNGEATPNTDNAPKSNWFKQPPRPPNPDPEWNKCQVIDDQPKWTWFNDLVSAEKDPLTFDEIMATPIDFSNIELEYNIEEWYKTLSDHLYWKNHEGGRCPFDFSKPLHLKGCLGHLTIASKYFFNNDLEYLNSINMERKYTMSIIKMKATRYELVGIEDMIPNQWSATKELVMRRADRQKYKFKEALGMFTISLIIKKRVEDVQLGVESYLKKLNISRPQKDFPTIFTKEPYTP
uniref:Uncharacterized protein n=1 Tax=Tanacetum cinerariifolium TaxID=118510 RepID=A0A699GY30_TANCI|nr:hypothetical protein [Tanacetum cinerariifolium]